MKFFIQTNLFISLSIFQTFKLCLKRNISFHLFLGTYLFNFLKIFLSTNIDAKLGLAFILRCALLHTFKGQSIKIALMAIKMLLRR